MRSKQWVVLAICLSLSVGAYAQSPGVSFPATDALGRSLPTYEEVGDIRPEKTVAMFFWTWHSGHSSAGRNYDLTEIITTPDMVNDYDHPNWAPYADSPFFWDEPLFGFYDGKDPWVARKQLEMLGAAGVDVLFYDATNGSYVWTEGYETMGDAMAQARADGVAVPQFAFMLNFGPQAATTQALADLYENMYRIGLYEESWFRWEGKPVVMAYPEAVGTPGSTAGMRFSAASAFTGINATCPSWANDIGDLTLSLYSWTGSYAESVTRPPLSSNSFVNFSDNEKLALTFSELPAGDYVWQLSGAREVVGVWKWEQDTTGVESYFDGEPVSGDYESEIQVSGGWTALTTGSSHVPVQLDEASLNSQPGETAGLRFTATSSFTGVDTRCPNWSNPASSVTLSLYNWAGDYAGSVAQAPLASQRFESYADNGRLRLEFAAQPAGDYLWELSDGEGAAGVWKFDDETVGIDSYKNGSLTSGDYESQVRMDGTWTPVTNGAATTPIRIEQGLDDATLAAILDFFTFRPGQPTYNQGPSRDDQWGWLENYPQHGYVEKSPGEYEFMTVGVAQNWSKQTNALSAMNGPLIHGRSYTHARGFSDLTPTSFVYGYNFQEQWDRALEVDPDIVFVTGWNEWVAGRHETWMGVENAFPDSYSPEYSRDIEPSRDGAQDAYYYQLVANIRRFKGMSEPAAPSPARTTIAVDGVFGDWVDVTPHFTASKGNVLVRDGYGYIDQHSPTSEHLHYTNDTARNDIVGAKVASDVATIYFYVAAATDLTPHTDPNWMQLLIDADRSKATGWEGYEWRVDRYAPDGTAILSASTGEWSWTDVATVDYATAGAELELAIPRVVLGTTLDGRIDIEFKWLDTPTPTGDIVDVYGDGEAAPGGRFNYHYVGPYLDEVLGIDPVGGTVEEGGAWTFEVALANPTGAVTYAWYQDGSILRGNGATLTLDPVLLSDEGLYHCEVSDDTGTYSTTPAHLNVTPAAPATPTASLVSKGLLITGVPVLLYLSARRLSMGQ